MTRNITFIIILILLIWLSCTLMFGKETSINEKFDTIAKLKESDQKLEKSASDLDKLISKDMPDKKKSLLATIETYKSTKAEYERVVAQYSNLSSAEVLENELEKDIYDVDFLWTIVGNYATEEGVNLKFDVTKNTTSPSSYNNDSSEYVVCDLNFSVTGSYINLTDFIYDIEDDDRLNFEINDFELKKNEDEITIEPLNAKFVVYAIKLNSQNLIENYVVLPNESTQEATTNTTNTIKTTNTANTTNKSTNTSTNTTKNSN